jgi:hypothetical protein
MNVEAWQQHKRCCTQVCPMADSPRQLKPSDAAAQAFQDFVALGPSRSLRKLHEIYCQQSDIKPPTKRFRTLAEWSTVFGWQDQIVNAATAISERMLNEAAELDADTFLKTSKGLNSRVDETSAKNMDIRDVIQIRESVRKPAPKGSASVDVSVNVNVQVRQALERIARERGLSVEDVLVEADRVLAESAL